MLIYGASGHSKVIIDVFLSNGEKEIFLFDDNLLKKDLLGFSVLGIYDPKYRQSDVIIIGIGDNKIRKKVCGLIKHKLSNAIHYHSYISKYATIGEGNAVFCGGIIQSGSAIGNHCIINTKASVDHDCKIEDFVHIGPNVTLCGGTTVGEGSLVGAGAIVIPGIQIGKWAIIAAGSVVIKNVPDFTMVAGNPAKFVKKINIINE